MSTLDKNISYGIIGFDQHRIECVIGIYAAEREKPQTIFIDLKVKVDLTACIQSGKIKDTVDYVALAQFCTDLAHTKKYFLLEVFAADILECCKKQFNASWAWVKIQKPAALTHAAYAFVEMERGETEVKGCGR